MRRRRVIRRRLWGFNPIAAIGGAVNNAANAVKNAAGQALRTVGGAVNSAVDAAGNAIAGAINSIGKAAQHFGQMAKGALDQVGKFANEARNVVKYLNKLTGGALANVLKSKACPLFVKGIYEACNWGMRAATGIPTLSLPTCLNGAITSACEDGVDKIFSRLRALR